MRTRRKNWCRVHGFHQALIRNDDDGIDRTDQILQSLFGLHMRRLPSKANGLVTTATVNAPSSLASDATTGAAPEPVPPPRPDVMKIMSEPSSASMILSVSSSAALRPLRIGSRAGLW